MKKIILFGLLVTACPIVKAQEYNIQSPGGIVRVIFSLNKKGQVSYQAFYKNKEFIRPSGMGFELKESVQPIEVIVIADHKP